jgi:hypothetical protein
MWELKVFAKKNGEIVDSELPYHDSKEQAIGHFSRTECFADGFRSRCLGPEEAMIVLSGIRVCYPSSGAAYNSSVEYQGVFDGFPE